MNFDPGFLLCNLILGSIGLGVFLYGKNASSAKCIVLGLLLMIVPSFLSSLLIECLFGAGCLAGLWFLPSGTS